MPLHLRRDRRGGRSSIRETTLARVSVLAIGISFFACSGALVTPGASGDASLDGRGSVAPPDDDAGPADVTSPDTGQMGPSQVDGGEADAPLDARAVDGPQDAPRGLADGHDSPGSVEAGVLDASAADAGDGALDDDGVSGSSEGDATADAGPTLAELMALCEGGGDVFYVDTVGPTNGDPPVGVQVFSDANAEWSASTSSLAVSVDASQPGGGASLSLTTSQGVPLLPGTYAEPINHSIPRPYLDLTVGDVSLTADGYTFGSFLVHDIGGAAVSGQSTAFLAVSFDITVPFPQASGEFRGCVRYGVTSIPDAGAAGVDATLDAPDASSSGGDAASCGDTNNDGHNCGTCGHDCLGGLCSAGVCTPVMLFSEAEGTPQGIAVDATNVYWVETEGFVRTVPKGGGDATLLATEPRGPTALVMDSGVLYWVSQAGTLRRLQVGDAMPTTLASFAGESFGVAVDVTYAYWTMIGQNPADGSPAGTVTAIPKAGGALLPIAGGQNVPDGIVVGAGSVCWLDLDTQLPQGSASVMKASLDGGTPVVVFPPAAGSAFGADAIASDATFVYFTSGGDLYRAPLAGGAAMIFASGLDATALAVDDSGVYALVGSKILKAPLTGGVALTMIQGLFSPRGLALDAQAVYFTDADVVMKIAK